MPFDDGDRPWYLVGMGFEPGALVGRTLRLRHLLAKGGMGSVWAADHLRLKTRVAVKLMADALSVERTAQMRFALEAEAIARIRSPHVVQVLDHGSTDEGIPYIVMELLEGESLGARLGRLGSVQLDEAVAIVSQTSKALARAHSLGFVHRDIKPDNVFLTESNGELFVKVLDFGIAKNHGEAMSMTRSGAWLGTPRYASPEQLVSAKHVTPGADLWSLAAVAYRALVGRPPFDGDSPGAIADSMAKGACLPPTKVRPDLPRELDIWFARALNVRRVNRFESAQQLAETFARAARVQAGVVVPARLPSRSAYLANEPGRAIDERRMGSAPTPSVIARHECIYFVPSSGDAAPSFPHSSTHHDADDGRSELGAKTRLYDSAANPLAKRK